MPYRRSSRGATSLSRASASLAVRVGPPPKTAKLFPPQGSSADVGGGRSPVEVVALGGDPVGEPGGFLAVFEPIVDDGPSSGLSADEAAGGVVERWPDGGQSLGRGRRSRAPREQRSALGRRPLGWPMAMDDGRAKREETALLAVQGVQREPSAASQDWMTTATSRPSRQHPAWPQPMARRAVRGAALRPHGHAPPLYPYQPGISIARLTHRERRRSVRGIIRTSVQPEIEPPGDAVAPGLIVVRW